MTTPARAVAAVLVVAALAALVVNQRLKDAPAYVRQIKVTDVFTPNGDGRRDRATVRLVLGRRDDVSLAVIDARGDVVRDLGTRHRRPAGVRTRFRWDGRTNAGPVAPAGIYRARIRLAKVGRAIVLEPTIRLLDIPPRRRGAPPPPGTAASPAAPATNASSAGDTGGSPAAKAALIVAALLAAAVLVLPAGRHRALAMVAGLVAAPALLLAHLWDDSQLAPLHDHPLLAAAAALVLGGALVALARWLPRRPELLVLAAVVAIPFRVPIPLGGTTVNLLVPLYVVIGLGVLSRLWHPQVVPGGRGRSRDAMVLRCALAGFVALYGLQAAYSSDFTQALEQVLFFYVPFALLFALLADIDWTPELLGRCLRILVALALLFCLVGFVQYATRTLIFNDKVKLSNAYTPYFRVNSLFFDPNIYGRFLALVAIALVAVVAWTRRRETVVRAAAVLAVLFLGLLTTRSQSSMVALLVGVCILLALRGRARVVAATAAALAVAAIAVVVIHPSVVGIGSENAATVRKATSGRSDLLSGGARLFGDRPLAGWGSGAFIREYRDRIQGGNSTTTTVAASHTIPVTVAVEQGVVGLAAYVALLAAAFRLLLRGARASLPKAALAALFGAVVVHTLLYAAFLEDPLAWALLAVACAIAAPRGSPPRAAAPGRERAAAPA